MPDFVRPPAPLMTPPMIMTSVADGVATSMVALPPVREYVCVPVLRAAVTLSFAPSVIVIAAVVPPMLLALLMLSVPPVMYVTPV